MKKNNMKEFVNGKGFYILLSLCFTVIIISAGVITVNNTNKINQEKEYAELNDEYNLQEVEPILNDEIAETVTGNIVELPTEKNIEVGAGLSEDIKDDIIIAEGDIEGIIENTQALIEETVVQISENTEIAIAQTNKTVEIPENTEPIVKQVFLSFNNDSKMEWPVVGEIVMDYSKDHTIYDKTLEQYRINNSISIGTEVGEQVKASAAGTVVSINKDNQKGFSVVLDHGNGWQTTYSQLQENIAVKENDIVEVGDIIGGVAEPTKYGVALGGHLEFEVQKDGVTIDPKLVLYK